MQQGKQKTKQKKQQGKFRPFLQKRLFWNHPPTQMDLLRSSGQKNTDRALIQIQLGQWIRIPNLDIGMLIKEEYFLIKTKLYGIFNKFF